MSRNLQNTPLSAHRPAVLLEGLASSLGFSAPDVQPWAQDRIQTQWVENRARHEQAQLVRTLFKRVFARN